MANTINFILTNAALELIPKILNGKTLNFTRMAVGDGFSYDATVAKGFKNLVNEVLNLEITKKEIENSSTVKITSAFTSSDVQKEFYYREVGLFAQDPDTGKEILYAYGNRNEAAELITPNGSSSVAKRLVFIVFVGDSANVTVNINSDIYDKADKNLANTGMITNCLLEVPQNIKLELNDGVLTLKEGSVVTKPTGEQKVVESDINYTANWANGEMILLYSDYSLSNSTVPNVIFSGETEPNKTDGGWWLDTTNKIFKQYSNGIWQERADVYLPIGLVTSDSTGITSINQVFNGIGYIDSTVWADKGIKGLISNERNPDGTLKSEIMTLPSVVLSNATADDGAFSVYITPSSIGMCRYYRSDSEPAGSGYMIWYNPTTNIIYTKADDNAEWIKAKTLIIGQCECQSSKFVSASINKPFNIVNYNDYANKIHQLEARLSLLEAK